MVANRLDVVGLAWLPTFGGYRDRVGFTLEDEVCLDSEEPLQPFFLCEPPEQVRMFTLMFCASVAFSLVVHSSGAERYYLRLAGSGSAISRLRGLGYTACRAYGVFPVPRLPASGLRLVGWMLVGTLLLACNSGLTPRFFLFASYGLYFLYFGQLSCESKHGGHGAILLPSVILLLALSGGPRGAPWSLALIKIFLGVIYFAGALSKLVVSAVFGKAWAGSTMQAYLLDAMSTRPSQWKVVEQLQGFIVTRWWMCTCLAASGLLFELGFLPLVLFGGPCGAVLAAAVAVGFHAGVGVLQGLDFFPFWCPVFYAFLADARLLISGLPPTEEETMAGVLAKGFNEEPFRWSLSVLYIGVQVIVALRFMDLRGKDCLPFSCCPMFAVPRNVFGDDFQLLVLTDANLRSGGFLDVAYNFNPWCTTCPMTDEDMRQYPGKLLFWACIKRCSPHLEWMVQPEFLGSEFLLKANFDLPLALYDQLEEYAQTLATAQPQDWADGEKVGQVVVMLARCRTLLEEAATMRKTPVRSVAGHL